MLRLLILCLFATPSFAGPFAELGVGTTVLNSCLYKDTEFYVADGQWHYRADCANAPLGFVSVGYRVPKSGLIFQYDHMSSIPDHDPGLDTVSIRYRWGAKD